MLSTKRDEPAFPTPTREGQYDGMTMREWYAGMALQGVLANSVGVEMVNRVSEAIGSDVKAMLARTAFEYADAMLEASKAK